MDGWLPLNAKLLANIRMYAPNLLRHSQIFNATVLREMELMREQAAVEAKVATESFLRSMQVVTRSKYFMEHPLMAAAR
jgi:hypothetical protein